MPRTGSRLAFAAGLAASLGACRMARVTPDEHAAHASTGSTGDVMMISSTYQETGLPASGAEAKARLAASPRHAEWAMIPTGVAPGDSIRAWIVYPERKTKAPVVIVVHEIFGLSPWIRSVADQFAAEGFIAVAPDLLTSKNVPGSPLDPNPDSARAAIGQLKPDVVHRQLAAVANYGLSLPAATKRYGIVGFCWGGGTSFAHAVAAGGNLSASVVYYGPNPAPAALASVRAPVLGFYGENDQRVNSTVPAADSTLKAMGRTYEYEFMKGAGHGFLRAQEGQNGANLEATKRAWPRTVAWFKKYLEA